MKIDWRSGNRLQLLENGEEFYPAVFDAVALASQEVLIETFILFDDPVGRALQQALIDAARRGVRVDLTVDGYGSPDLSPEFIGAMTEAGVRFHVFDPSPRFLGLRVNLLRRLHRKIVVVDGRIAFVGGINYSQDHLLSSGPMAKQDYAVRIEGPVVANIRTFASNALAPTRRPRLWSRQQHRHAGDVPAAFADGADAAFVTRDNRRHRDDIERVYRAAIRSAREEVIIANAYFFPGYRLLRDMVRAARRGVRVQLILQGEPDMAYVRTAARVLYDALVKDGVQIFEYLQRPLHGKVAVVDGEWSTVGSSNLDPLSLALNLEANLIVRDRAFAAQLRDRLLRLERDHSRLVHREHPPRLTRWRYLVGALGYHVARHFPSWLQWLPERAARIHSFHEQGVRAVPVSGDQTALGDPPR